MSTLTFKQHMMLEEMGFTKEDLNESFFVTIAPYIFAAYRLQRALRNASTGIKYMNRSQSIKMADEFIGPPRPVRFGDPDFVGPGPGTLMRPNRFRNFAKSINITPALKYFSSIINGFKSVSFISLFTGVLNAEIIKSDFSNLLIRFDKGSKKSRIQITSGSK